MKTISILISTIFYLLIFWITYLNISNVISLESGPINIRVSVGGLIFLAAIMGSFATVFTGIAQGLFVNKRENKLSKQVENVKLKHEIESDKVKQLEAKIKTLEEALKAAIGK